MPRRQFVEDLDAACKGISVAGISKVEKGEDVGEFSFHCAVADTSVQLIVQLPEVFDYPTEHMCFISAADNVPAAIAESLADIAEGAAGKTIRQMLEHVSQCLQSKDEDGNMEMPDSQDYDGFEDSDEEAEDFFPDDEPTSIPFAPRLSSGPGLSCTQSSLHFRQTIRADLMEAKSNGFKVGKLPAITMLHASLLISSRLFRRPLGRPCVLCHPLLSYIEAWHIRRSHAGLEHLAIRVPCSHLVLSQWIQRHGFCPREQIQR